MCGWVMGHGSWVMGHGASKSQNEEIKNIGSVQRSSKTSLLTYKIVESVSMRGRGRKMWRWRKRTYRAPTVQAGMGRRFTSSSAGSLGKM
jgi:hypothetical protein